MAVRVAGLATHAGQGGRTTIFFENEPPVVAPRKPTYGYKETSALLSWLPPVPGAESPPEARSGRRHLPVPGEIPGVLSSFLNHREYAPAKPRARGSLKPGGAGGRSRSRSRPAELSPSKLAAKLLPPIHGRTQPAEVEPPGWAVKSKRPPFKGR